MTGSKIMKMWSHSLYITRLSIHKLHFNSKSALYNFPEVHETKPLYPTPKQLKFEKFRVCTVSFRHCSEIIKHNLQLQKKVH